MEPSLSADNLDARALYNILASLPGLVYQFFINTNTGDYGISFVGPQLSTILGLSPTQPDLYDALVALLVEEDRARFLKSNLDAVTHESEWHFEGRWRTKSGEVRWFEARSTPERQGDELRFNGIIFDTTDFRQAEETLRLYFEQSVVAISLVGEDGRILAWNQLMADLSGIQPEEAIGQYYWDVIWLILPEKYKPLWKTQLEQLLRAALSSGAPDSWNAPKMKFVRRDGQPFIVEQTTFPIRTSRGYRYGVIARDITKRHFAEQKLRESEADLARAQATAHLGSWTWDPNTGVVTWSDELYRIFGLDPRTFTPSTSAISELLHPEDRLVHDAAVESAIAGTPVPAFDLRVMRPDGTARIMRASGFDLEYDSRGKLRRIYGAVLDVTEQQEAEHERKRLENQLLQAMKMEAVGRLAGGVAHDFNNLLTGILGNVELLYTDPLLTARAGESLAQIKKAGDSAAALTRQLLAFSRRQIIEPKVVEVNQLIGGLHKLLARIIGEDVQLRFMPGEGLGHVKVDPGQFEQILVNLAVNARDAMPQGGLLLIETSAVHLDEHYTAQHAGAKPGPHVRISVSDTGYGMNDEVKAHIFEPFYTTKSIGHGTGLGLATAYGAVKQAQGAIEVYSEEGHGTTFKIYLPCTAEEAPQKNPDEEPAPLRGGTETVLLVEDDSIVRQVAKAILDYLGYHLLIAENSHEALELAARRKEPIHLLLTDVIMPGLNGRQLAEKLILLHPETRILYTSGYTANVIVHRGVLDEGLAFLSKPYTPQSLAAKLRELLDA